MVEDRPVEPQQLEALEAQRLELFGQLSSQKALLAQLMEALPAAANPDELSALKAQLEDSLSRLQQQIEQLIPAAKVSQPRYFDREYLSNQILPDAAAGSFPPNAHWNCCIRSRLPLPNSWALPISSRLTEQSSWKSS